MKANGSASHGDREIDAASTSKGRVVASVSSLRHVTLNAISIR